MLYVYIMLGLVLFTIVKYYIMPIISIKEVDINIIEDDRYCFIDVRDYISAHRSPFPKANNIPLSYLAREVKKQLSCEKDICLITDDMKGARMAARIIQRRTNTKIYYMKAL